MAFNTENIAIVIRPNTTDPKKFTDIYLKNVPVYFASVHEVTGKYQSEEKEFKLTAFVTQEVREALEDAMVNKTLYEVGKDKNKKRKIKYKLSTQLEEGEKHHYDEVKGLHGLTLTLKEFTSKGKKAAVTVIDTSGKPFTDLVGNGSVCNIKLFAYKNKDEQLVVSLNTVQVVEHVPYNQSGGDGVVEDDILGSYSVKRVIEDTAPVGEKKPTPSTSPAQEDVDDDFDEGIPF